MSDNEKHDQEEIHSEILRAGRRTYFFDVRSTRAGDYYLTVTESKKHTADNGQPYYKKHKIYLYKEDFENFKTCLENATEFILDEKGEEVISEKHEPDFHKKHTEKIDLNNEEENDNNISEKETTPKAKTFTDVSFDDI
jgi:hypothetical protein